MKKELSIPKELLPTVEKADYLTAIGVQWGEMNAAGHVSNVTFFRWFETARMDYFLHLYPDSMKAGTTQGFMVKKQGCQYYAPVFYPDQVFLALHANDLKEDRFKLECRMYSRQTSKQVAVTNCELVMYDFFKQEKMAIPDHIVKRIEKSSKSKEGGNG